MISFYKRYYKTIFDIALMVVTIYLFMLIFSYLYKIATPIFLSFVIFAIIEPLARLLHKKGIKKSIASAVSMLIFILIILGIIVGAGVILTLQIGYLADKIPTYTAMLQTQIQSGADYLQEKIHSLPPGWLDKTEEYTSILANKGGGIITALLTYLFNRLSSFSSSIVSFTLNFGIGIILAYFLSVEIERWRKLAREKTPKTFKIAFFFLKDNVLSGLAKYLKAQLKLVSVTFLIIFAGLLILGVKNAFTVSLLTAFCDFLPLLGVPVIFIPWIVYLLIIGDLHLAIGLTVLLAVALISRQLLEPKITGDSLGVSAFTMLSFMIISLSIFGISGLIISPILIILIKALHEKGYLKKWIRQPLDEYDET